MAAMALVRMGIKPLVIDSGGPESHEYGRADALQPRYAVDDYSLASHIDFISGSWRSCRFALMSFADR